MALASITGSPPAVTHEQVEAWTKLADDVSAALTMGGEQGLNLLLGIMAEWCEAVDDVNSARQICIDLADRGLRHEAIQWHADGFFEVADRLDPDRPGWEAWAAAFQERDVVVPRMDAQLRELTNRIHEDLEARDLTGQSIVDYLGVLRRNVLLKGHLGERLVTLESIRGLDPAAAAWIGMIRPIRKLRVTAIADEVRAAVGKRDYEALARLRAEVDSQDWGEDLPRGVTDTLEAARHCESLATLRGQLSRLAATVVTNVEAGQRQPGPVSLTEPGPGVEAMAARAKYAELRTSLVRVVQSAAATPETAAIVQESGIVDAMQQLDAAVREPFLWLDHQQQLARARVIAAGIEADVRRHMETAPEKTSSLETFAPAFKAWNERAATGLEQARKAAAVLTGGTPDSTGQIFQLMENKRLELRQHLDGLKNRDRNILLYFLVGVGVFLLLLLIVVVVIAVK